MKETAAFESPYGYRGIENAPRPLPKGKLGLKSCHPVAMTVSTIILLAYPWQHPRVNLKILLFASPAKWLNGNSSLFNIVDFRS